MSTIVTRAGKGSALSWNEADANFTNLNNDKIQSGDTVASLAITSITVNGGTIQGITDLAIADGGTGASTAAAARVNLLPSYTGNGSKVLALNSGATDVEWVTGGGSMVYPSAGIAVSTGTAWGTSLTAPSGDIVGTTDTQTLTNKTLSGASNTFSNIGNSSLTNSSITVNGTAISLGASGTITANTTNSLTIGTGLSGTSFNGGSAVTIAIDSTVATLTGSQTLTNKTLTSPVISSIVNTGTLTLPTSTDTLVGRATTDTLTNKTIALGSNTVSGTKAQFDTACTDDNFAYVGTANSFTATNTFKGVTSTVFTITDTAGFQIDPANGEIQTVTLGANRTPAATNFAAGQCVLLGVDDGTAYTITWTTVGVTWVKAGGSASAPTLATTGFTWILLWKVGSTVYGTLVGSP